MKLMLFFIFIYALNIYSQNEKSFNYYVDSLFCKLQIDTAGYPLRDLIAANIEDIFNNKFVETSECGIIPVVYPKIESFLDSNELKFVLQSDSISYQFLYLEDNDIKGSLYKISSDSSFKRMKLEKLGTDINVNFGEVIAVAFYEEGLIRCFIDYECKKFRNIRSAQFFFYKENKPNKIILITEKAGEVNIRQTEK